MARLMKCPSFVSVHRKQPWHANTHATLMLMQTYTYTRLRLLLFIHVLWHTIVLKRDLPLLFLFPRDTERPIETRLKVGEAIIKVARRCGEALPKYANLILPGVLQVCPLRHGCS